MAGAEADANVPIVERSEVHHGDLRCCVALEAFYHGEVLRGLLSTSFELLQIYQGDERLFLIGAEPGFLFEDVQISVATADDQLFREDCLGLRGVLQTYVVQVWH